MESFEDELMNEPNIVPVVHEVYFQFDDDEPIKLAYLVDEDEFSLTLKAIDENDPMITFSNGKGKEFKLFLKKDNGLQQENIQY